MLPVSDLGALHAQRVCGRSTTTPEALIAAAAIIGIHTGRAPGGAPAIRHASHSAVDTEQQHRDRENELAGHLASGRIHALLLVDDRQRSGERGVSQ